MVKLDNKTKKSLLYLVESIDELLNENVSSTEQLVQDVLQSVEFKRFGNLDVDTDGGCTEISTNGLNNVKINRVVRALENSIYSQRLKMNVIVNYDRDVIIVCQTF